ncbi:MAG: hypothetical protein OZ923_02460 [Comamonadaceae bacterium]|nr:hypothetical protein [Burkholderiales bacterium]MEB2347453.1 hypothetical protein [Comamonadaceae bacterium]
MRITAAEAKNRFGYYLSQAEREPVHVRKNERVAGVIISAARYAEHLPHWSSKKRWRSASASSTRRTRIGSTSRTPTMKRMACGATDWWGMLTPSARVMTH